MKSYTIGEFAEICGVTPDFLKYYEKQGILRPEVGANGYRRYTLRDWSYVQECIKLKNMDFSAREIARLMKQSHYDQIVGLMDERRPEVERQQRFLQEMLAYTAAASRELERYGKPDSWGIGRHGDFYYVSQLRDMRYLENRALHHITREWQQWMPVVQPCARVDDRPGCTQLEWGSAVPAAFARAQGLPLGAPVEYVPAGRYLEYFDQRVIPDDMNNDDLPGVRASMLANVQKVLQRYGFAVTGSCYLLVQAKIREEGERRTYQKIYVPIA